MAIVAKVEGVERVLAKLRHLAKAYADSPNKVQDAVIVGYTAAYALYVHENREMKWRGFPRDRSIRKEGDIARTGYSAGSGKGLFWGPQGRAGFLLDVARELSRELGEIVAKGLKRGLKMVDALLLAGLRLQRESQLNVPVDTGNLKASAFTRVE